MLDSDGFPFSMDEELGDDGTIRLVLTGELDIAVSDRVRVRLEQLAAEKVPVRLDLSGLTFLDSTGISVLLRAVHAAREHQTRLETGPEVAPQVRRVLEMTSVDEVLWPAASSGTAGACAN